MAGYKFENPNPFHFDTGRGVLGLEINPADLNLFYNDETGLDASIGTNLEGVFSGQVPPFFGEARMPLLGGTLGIGGTFPVGGYRPEGQISYRVPLEVLDKLENPFIPSALKEKLMRPFR